MDTATIVPATEDACPDRRIVEDFVNNEADSVALSVELVQHDDAVPLGSLKTTTNGAIAVHGLFKVGVTIDDFDATLAALKSRGVEIAYGPYPKRPDQPANVIIRDNAGNLIQISGR